MVHILAPSYVTVVFHCCSLPKAERDFPQRVCVIETLWILDVNERLMLAADVSYPRKKGLQIIWLLLLASLTLVLAVAVSVLVDRLPVGARPVTGCLLATGRPHRKRRADAREGTKWSKLYVSEEKTGSAEALTHKHSCLLALYIVKKIPSEHLQHVIDE